MNLTALTSTAAQFSGDPAQSRYSGLYTQALNLGQQQFVLDSKCLWKDWPATTITAAVASYALPSDFILEQTVAFNGVPLIPISRAELLRTHQDSRWDTIPGTPTHYVIDPDVSKSQLLLFPIPTSYDAGKDLVLTYVALPADMSGATDIPFNSTPLLAQFHMGICAWAAWYLLNGEASVTDSLRAKKADLLQIYNDCVSQAVETFKNTASQPMRQRGSRVY